jgi:hypothetical protein
MVRNEPAEAELLLPDAPALEEPELDGLEELELGEELDGEEEVDPELPEGDDAEPELLDGEEDEPLLIEPDELPELPEVLDLSPAAIATPDTAEKAKAKSTALLRNFI